LENNIYGLALVVRGHYEATAVLGYFCNRLESLKVGNITFEDFAWNIAYEVLGARHEQFAKAPNPPNILTCIEKADKYLDTHCFQQKKGMLLDCYNWLSDFAHPNFLSNASSFTLDLPNRTAAGAARSAASWRSSSSCRSGLRSPLPRVFPELALTYGRSH
jgi:hypothetical protein